MILEGLISVESNDNVDWTIKNHHNILDRPEHRPSDDEEEGSKAEDDNNPILKLRHVEVEVILVEHLNSHFTDEFDRVVCAEVPPHTIDTNPCCCQPGLVRKVANTEPGSPPPPRPLGPVKSHKRQHSGVEPSGKSTKHQKTKSKSDMEDEAQIGDSEMEEA